MKAKRMIIIDLRTEYIFIEREVRDAYPYPRHKMNERYCHCVY